MLGQGLKPWGGVDQWAKSYEEQPKAGHCSFANLKKARSLELHLEREQARPYNQAAGTDVKQETAPLGWPPNNRPGCLQNSARSAPILRMSSIDSDWIRIYRRQDEWIETLHQFQSAKNQINSISESLSACKGFLRYGRWKREQSPVYFQEHC